MTKPARLAPILVLGLSLHLGALGADLAAARPSPGADGGDNGDYDATVPRLAAAPEIDGRLAAGEWQEAAEIGDFVQFEPTEGAAASERTVAWLGYDDKNLYIGLRGYDSRPGELVANILTRDGDLSYDDTIRVLLATFGDGKSAFLFATNPLGVKVDALVRKEGEELNYDWDGDWTCAASRDPAGFTVEMAIPFKTLRFRPAPEQVWGFNVQRSIARKREEVFWKPMLHAYGSYPWFKISRLGRLRGITEIEQAGRTRLRPYLTVGRTTQTVDGQTVGGESDSVFEPGLDVKYNVTTELVADFTLNTDFAEAQADDQQINLTRFPLFFPEKREFFLEGANLFYFGDRAEPFRAADNVFFFSRRIGLTENGGQEIPVLGGAKIAGGVAGFEVGALHVTTDEETVRDPLGDGLTEEAVTHYSVLRAKRQIFEKSSLGFLFLNKDPEGAKANRVAGLDWDLALGENLQSGGYLVKSSAPGRVRDSVDERDEWAGSADLYYDTKHVRSRLAFTEIGESFVDELGFLPRLGVRKWRGLFDYIFWPEGKKVRQAWVTYDIDHITDTDGELETRVQSVQLNGFFQSSAGLAFKIFDRVEVIDVPFEIDRGIFIPPGRYEFQNFFFGFQTDYSKKVGGAGRFLVGEFWDGDLVQSFGALVVRPVDGFFSAFAYERNDVELPAGDFTTELFQSDVSYSIADPEISAQVSFQWNEEENSLLRLLLKWNYRADSTLFVVYEDLRDLTNPFDRFRQEVGIPGRSLLIKAVHTF